MGVFVKYSSNMQLVLKTLDNKVIQVDVGEDENIRNIVDQIKDKWGAENTYKMIYAGKVLKEGNYLSDYRVTGSLPIIVLVTRPNSQNIVASKRSSRPVRIAPSEDEASLKNRSRGYALAHQTRPVYNDCPITDSDFSSALQLIMKCNYLFQEDVGKISREDMLVAVHKKFKDDDPEEAPVKEMIMKKLEEVLTAGPNEAQFNAFLTLGFCWCQTFQPNKD